MMSKCTSIDPLVTPYVDGELPAAERTLVDEHLRPLSALSFARRRPKRPSASLMRARKPGLTAERASASLLRQCSGLANGARTRPRAIAARSRPRSGPRAAIARRGGRRPGACRLVPLALTASLVLLVGGAFLYQRTQHSARVLAAELCRRSRQVLRRQQRARHARRAGGRRKLDAVGLRLASASARAVRRVGLELVGARRCLYGEGKVAHLMYRDQGRPVSIFMLPKSVRVRGARRGARSRSGDLVGRRSDVRAGRARLARRGRSGWRPSSKGSATMTTEDAHPMGDRRRRARWRSRC